MKWLLTLALLAFTVNVNAQSEYPRDISYCWINPSEYVDGTLIEAGELTTLRVEVYRNNDTVPTFTMEIPATEPGVEQCATLPLAIPQPGTYTGIGYARANGLWSDPSDPSAPSKYTGKPLAPVFTQVFE